jgi:hypothetical protein
MRQKYSPPPTVTRICSNGGHFCEWMMKHDLVLSAIEDSCMYWHAYVLTKEPLSLTGVIMWEYLGHIDNYRRHLTLKQMLGVKPSFIMNFDATSSDDDDFSEYGKNRHLSIMQQMANMADNEHRIQIETAIQKVDLLKQVEEENIKIKEWLKKEEDEEALRPQKNIDCYFH